MNLRWPWVSYGRYADMRERAESAEERCDALQDQLVRLTRSRNGRPEVPPDEKDTEPEVLPEVVRKRIQAFSSDTVQDQLKQEAWRARKQGTPWSEIARKLGAETAGG